MYQLTDQLYTIYREARRGPWISDGKFPEIFTGGNLPYDIRASIFTCLFFTVISVFREIFTVLSMF
jgi:hypothetical protein